MLDFKHSHVTEAPLPAETNAWDAIVVLLNNRAELVSKVVSFASTETKATYQEQIDDIDKRIEYLIEYGT